MPSADPFDLNEAPQLPRDPKRYGIGIVGAGGIVRSAHLPAYQKAGFRVEAIYDTDHARAEEAAREFGIARVCRSEAELLDLAEVAIVDIAVPAEAQPAIARRALEAGKHLLCQKPFAMSLEEARAIVDAAEKAGRRVAVNQNMRFSPVMLAMRTLIERGWLGELVGGEIQVNVNTPWDLWEWILSLDRLEILYHSIHYLDALRSLLGNPSSVYCQGLRYPGQRAKGETRTTTLLEYPDERRGLVRVEHNNPNDESDWIAQVRFEGSKGTAKGSFGALFNYPVGRGDTLSYRAQEVTGDAWVEPRLVGKWFPDGFVGTMAELMCSLDEEREPLHSGRDNLHTLELVFGAYRSMEEHRPIPLGREPR